MYVFALRNMYTAKVCMFSPECTWQAEKHFQFGDSFNDDYIQKAVIRTGIRAELKAASFVFLVHYSHKPGFPEGLWFASVKGYRNRRRGEEEKLFQRHHKIDQFAHMETVEKFFPRGDQDFLADCSIVTHSRTDAEPVRMAAKMDHRNIHGNRPSVLKDGVKCFKRIKWQAHAAAEIIAGPNRNKSKDD